MKNRSNSSPADYIIKAATFLNGYGSNQRFFNWTEKSAGEFYGERVRGKMNMLSDSAAGGLYKLNSSSKPVKSAADSLYPSNGFVTSFRVLSGIFMFLLLMTTAPVTNAQQTYTGSDGLEVSINDMSRVVSIGSAVTETIFALGVTENLVAVDESSTYPPETENYTKVSFTRNLSAEGLLSVSPSVILASAAAGPEPVIQQIRSTGVPFLKLTSDETVEGAFERVKQLGRIFDKVEVSEKIIQNMQDDLIQAEQARNQLAVKPTVLFIYARGANTLMVAGNGTSAKSIIELAGGINAFNTFEGYKPLTAEAVVEANPDVILMMDSGLESVGGKQGVLKAPGISLTNAAKNDRIYSMDGIYMLNFGPRVGQAALDLMKKLHPGIQLTENPQTPERP